MLCLEGAQAGLSWLTILKKRDNYRKAFANFDPRIIANGDDDSKVEQLLQNEGIVRNRLKIKSVMKNARGFKEIVEEHGSFSKFVWGFVGGKVKVNEWKSLKECPSQNEDSVRMSKELKKYGFSFVGPTIVYAFMQAVGMVNDHIVDCFRYEECKKATRS